MTAKRCPVCLLHFPKPKRYSMKEWARQETCSRKYAGVLRERAEVRKVADRSEQEAARLEMKMEPMRNEDFEVFDSMLGVIHDTAARLRAIVGVKSEPKGGDAE